MGGDPLPPRKVFLQPAITESGKTGRFMLYWIPSRYAGRRPMGESAGSAVPGIPEQWLRERIPCEAAAQSSFQYRIF